MAKRNRNPILERAFSEVFSNEPKIVAKTRKKKGAKRALAQKKAIAFSKARAAGARIPKPRY